MTVQIADYDRVHDEKAGDVVKALGAEEYFRKPAGLDELVRAIHRLLGTPIEVLTEIQK